MICETPELPGIEPRPQDKLRRLNPIEDAQLKRFRAQARAMQRRTDARLEHVLANLPRWEPGRSLNSLHQQLNTGKMGRYTRAEVKAFLATLEKLRRVRKLANKRWAKL